MKKIVIIGDDNGQVGDAIAEAQATGIIPEGFTFQRISPSALGQGVQSPPCRLNCITSGLYSAQNGQGAGFPPPHDVIDFLQGKTAWSGDPR